MATVTLKNIYKVYQGGVQAVSDFCLDIEDREFIVLVGPSGCGKTTTLRMVAGLEEITDGELYIGDKLVNDVPPKDRDIAMVFQNYALYPHMTVYDNMAFGLKLRHMPKAEIASRVQEAAKILSIEHLLNRKPKALSGGQRQRVALGRAIVREPKVFLMDEPLSNLDAKLRVQMRAELIKLHARLSTTFIYVTHDQTEAMTMGTRIVVMKDGFVQQIDTPQNCYDYPVNVFVAGFIGTPPMNFFEPTLSKEGDKYFVNLGDNHLQLPQSIIDRFATLDEHLDMPITMGIRPEHIHDEPRYLNEMPEFIVNAKVDVIELMGASTNLSLIISGKEEDVTATVDPHSLSRPGDNIRVVLDLNQAHFFDKDTEASLLARR